MLKRRVKADDHALAGNEQEVKVRSPEGLGERVLLALGLERKESANLWLYKDNSGGIYITQEPREGIRRIHFVSREKES